MNREALIATGARALSELWSKSTYVPSDTDGATAVIDAIMPLISDDDLESDDPSYDWHREYVEDQMKFAERVAARLVEIICEQDQTLREARVTVEDEV